MLKKVNLPVAIPNLAFKKRVEALASEGGELAKSFRDLSERMLKFALHIQELVKRAEKLDGSVNGEHKKLLREELRKAVGAIKGFCTLDKFLDVTRELEHSL